MKTNPLDPTFRSKLSDLLQGFVEHCEVSEHLTARIDVPIYYHGFKFGSPVFTHNGPPVRGGERPVFGLMGLNNPESRFPSDILLQFIEILAQQPHLADDAVLRIMPVANPVALELQQDAPTIEEWPTLQHLLDDFQNEAADGSIGIHTGKSSHIHFEGSASPTLIAALEDLEAGFVSDDSDGKIFLPGYADLEPVDRDAKWNLRLHVPADWTGPAKAHGIARFLSRLLKSHAWRTNARGKKLLIP